MFLRVQNVYSGGHHLPPRRNLQCNVPEGQGVRVIVREMLSVRVSVRGTVRVRVRVRERGFEPACGLGSTGTCSCSTGTC
jgi:hypothetical protein